MRWEHNLVQTSIRAITIYVEPPLIIRYPIDDRAEHDCWIHDWSRDVKKYIPSANEAAITGIVKHLGIALQSRDASFVAWEDKTER